MIKYITGDLFDYIKPNIIIPHCCNSEVNWGRGFVLPLKAKYPQAETDFVQWRLGYMAFSCGTFDLGCTQFVVVEPNVVIANMVGQVFYVKNGSLRQHRPLYYNKLADCMERVSNYARMKELDILAPKFGSELAGGNWHFIVNLIEDIWYDLNVTIVEFAP